MIADIFQIYQVPEYVWKPIEQVESGGNPNAVGDNGTSFGLFQLHWGGLGTGYSELQLKDPTINATIAAKKMGEIVSRKEAQGLTGYDLTQYVAYNAGFPTQMGVKALAKDPVVQAYEPRLAAAYNDMMGGGSIVIDGVSSTPHIDAGQALLDPTHNPDGSIRSMHQGETTVTGNPFSWGNLFTVNNAILIGALVGTILIIVHIAEGGN